MSILNVTDYFLWRETGEIPKGEKAPSPTKIASGLLCPLQPLYLWKNIQSGPIYIQIFPSTVYVCESVLQNRTIITKTQARFSVLFVKFLPCSRYSDMDLESIIVNLESYIIFLNDALVASIIDYTNI